MSGRKNVLPSYQIFTSGDMSQTTLTSPVTDISGIDNARIFISFTGAPTGTFDVQTSPDGTNWFSLALAPAPIASGGADTITVYLNQLPDSKIRTVYTKTSGTGTLNGWITGKAV